MADGEVYENSAPNINCGMCGKKTQKLRVKCSECNCYFHNSCAIKDKSHKPLNSEEITCLTDNISVVQNCDEMETSSNIPKMSIEIFFDDFTGVCYPGQTITGRLECVFNKEKNLRAIRLKFEGRADTEWYECQKYYDPSAKREKKRKVRYNAEEVYFEQEHTLVQGDEIFTLPEGRHVYPFTYVLPTHVPSSLEREYGSIRYTVKGVVDRPWKRDYEKTIKLQLCSPFNSTYLSELRESSAISVDKSLWCCWCKSGPITFNVSLPVTGYCSGQKMNIEAYVHNMSNVRVEKVQFKIVQQIDFFSHYPSVCQRHEERIIAECVKEGIASQEEKSWTCTLSIPTDETYPNLIPCSIISISYQLTGIVVLPWPHSNLNSSLSCMIGTRLEPSSVNTTLGPSNIELSGESTVPIASESDSLLALHAQDSNAQLLIKPLQNDLINLIPDPSNPSPSAGDLPTLSTGKSYPPLATSTPYSPVSNENEQTGPRLSSPTEEVA